MRMRNQRQAACRFAAWLAFAVAAPACAQNSAVGKYNGPGGCASSSCHGSILPKQVTYVAQNEYSIWAGQDKHARAYQVLSNDVSVRIGKILDLKTPPDKNPKCLACHALSVAPEMRAQSFDISDGVSCEHCHGPAAGWLGPHTVKEWESRTGDQKAQLGMRDLRDIAIRSHNCLHCHVGIEEQSVDHQMIAAGHPDLTLEGLRRHSMVRNQRMGSRARHAIARQPAQTRPSRPQFDVAGILRTGLLCLPSQPDGSER